MPARPSLRTVVLVSVVAACVLAPVGAAVPAQSSPAVAAPSAAALDAQSSPTVSVADGTVEAGTKTSVEVTLDRAPDGLRLYNLTVTLGTGDVARVTDAEAGDVGGFQVRSRSDDAITVRAADIAQQVGPDARDVTLAVVTLAGTANGETAVEVRVNRMQNDEGESMSVTTTAGTLTVTGSAATPEPDDEGTTTGRSTPTGTATQTPTPTRTATPTPTPTRTTASTSATTDPGETATGTPPDSTPTPAPTPAAETGAVNAGDGGGGGDGEDGGAGGADAPGSSTGVPLWVAGFTVGTVAVLVVAGFVMGRRRR